MQTDTQSLLDYLRVPNPEINGRHCPGGTNSKSRTGSWEAPEELSQWKDFDYDTLISIYNGELHRVLLKRFTLQDFSKVPDFPFRWFFDENSLESLLIKWNHSVVSEALENAQAKLESPEERVYMVRGGQAKHEKQSKPDWGCVKLPVSNFIEKKRNLLPGDTKVSTKWKSECIKYGKLAKHPMPMDDLAPLSQIYTYCLRNETRYGYIITDKELVAVRVRFQQEKSDSQKTFESLGSAEPQSQESLFEKSRKAGVLDCKIIPWKIGTDQKSDEDRMSDMDRMSDTQDTPDGLTVNLALWWLHILAAGNIDIADEETYGALSDEYSTVWDSPVPNLETLAMNQVGSSLL